MAAKRCTKQVYATYEYKNLMHQKKESYEISANLAQNKSSPHGRATKLRKCVYNLQTEIVMLKEIIVENQRS